MDEVMTIEGLTAIGLAPPAEGIPPPQSVATGDPFANAFAAAMAASVGKTGASGTASSLSMSPGLLVDPNQPWLALLGTPAIEGVPIEQGAVEVSRPDRSAEADIEDAMMASTLALAALLGLERPVVSTPSSGSPTGANGDALLLAGGSSTSMPAEAIEVLEVAADGGDVPAAPTPKGGATVIEVLVTETAELSLPKPELAAASRAAVSNIEAAPSAAVALQAAASTDEGIEPRRPTDLVDALGTAEAPDAAEASTGSGLGGPIIDGDAATATSGAIAAVASEESSNDPLNLSAKRSTDAVDAATTGQAAQAPQSRTEANVAATSTVETTIEAGDGERLVRGLADTVQRATRQGENGLRLVLNPPDLGHLDIRIEHSDRGVRIILSAESAHAGDLIQQHLPALRQALEARDLRVDRIDVQSSDASSNLDDGGDQTQRRQDGDGDQPRWSSVASMDQAEQQADGEAVPVTERERGGGGLLDLVA